MPATIQFALEGIAHLVADRRLEVPVYQRSYAWDEEQVLEYWEDLKRALDSGADEYFMGTIVAAGDGTVSTVIDGQQRLATTTVLLASIRDAYAARNDAGRAQGIHRKYLTLFDLATADDVPRLSLNAEDNTFFHAAIIEGIRQTMVISSHRRLPCASNSEDGTSGPHPTTALTT